MSVCFHAYKTDKQREDRELERERARESGEKERVREKWTARETEEEQRQPSAPSKAAAACMTLASLCAGGRHVFMISASTCNCTAASVVVSMMAPVINTRRHKRWQ